VRWLSAFALAAAPACSLFVSADDVDIGVRIDRIDGTGSGVPVVSAPDVADARPAVHRLRDRLIVDGAGLLSVSSAALAAADNTVFSLVGVDGGSDMRRAFLLPANIRA
jgi:hypothetical protein